jgi:hypothetical protein
MTQTMQKKVSFGEFERDRTLTELAIIYSSRDQLVGSLGDGGVRPCRIAVHVDHEHVLGPREIL